MTEHRFLSVSVVHDEIIEHRRVPVESPYAVLNVAAGKTVRKVRLDRPELARLLAEAAKVNLILEPK